MGKKGFECEIPDLTKLSAELDYFFPDTFQTGFIKYTESTKKVLTAHTFLKPR
jgi:hypothetical protein